MIDKFIVCGEQSNHKSRFDLDIQKLYAASDEFTSICHRIKELAKPFDSVVAITALSLPIARKICHRYAVVLLSRTLIIGKPSQRTLAVKYTVTDGLSSMRAIQLLEKAGFTITELLSVLDCNMNAQSNLHVPYNFLFQIASSESM